MSAAEQRDAASLRAAADQAMAAGDLRGARELLEQAVLEQAGDPALWMSLAACRRGLGDVAGAGAAVEGALRIEPRFYLALLMKASLLERQGDWRKAGAAYGVALTQAPPLEGLNDAVRRATVHAREVHARYLDELADALHAGISNIRSQCAGPETRRIDAFIDRLSGKRKVYHQEPVQFHYPGLPAIEFHDREDFPWLEEFESYTGKIQAELMDILQGDSDDLTPYVDYPDGVPLDQWAELNRSRRWSGFHLLLNGEPVEENCRRCPKTMEAVALLPQPRIAARSPAAMFSVLEPHTRIPPHNGVSNTRLVLHLPLVLPPGCGFRVGSETRQWRMGEAWVFDDTIDHEAWNDSDQARTIMICDLWNPHLSEAERELIAQVTLAMDRFSGAAPADGI
jgi:aspartate beta-hydroxylase